MVNTLHPGAKCQHAYAQDHQPGPPPSTSEPSGVLAPCIHWCHFSKDAHTQTHAQTHMMTAASHVLRRPIAATGICIWMSAALEQHWQGCLHRPRTYAGGSCRGNRYRPLLPFAVTLGCSKVQQLYSLRMGAIASGKPVGRSTGVRGNRCRPRPSCRPSTKGLVCAQDALGQPAAPLLGARPKRLARGRRCSPHPRAVPGCQSAAELRRRIKEPPKFSCRPVQRQA